MRLIEYPLPVRILPRTGSFDGGNMDKDLIVRTPIQKCCGT